MNTGACTNTPAVREREREALDIEDIHSLKSAHAYYTLHSRLTHTRSHSRLRFNVLTVTHCSPCALAQRGLLRASVYISIYTYIYHWNLCDRTHTPSFCMHFLCVLCVRAIVCKNVHTRTRCVCYYWHVIHSVEFQEIFACLRGSTICSSLLLYRYSSVVWQIHVHIGSSRKRRIRRAPLLPTRAPLHKDIEESASAFCVS